MSHFLKPICHEQEEEGERDEKEELEVGLEEGRAGSRKETRIAGEEKQQ